MTASIVSRVVAAYDDWIVKLYCLIRFQIIHQRFLDEIGQYLPPKGAIFDIGCGFGLFSLYFARCNPGAAFTGIDLSARRIGIARRAAENLSLKNVIYDVGDARNIQVGKTFDAVYMLDIVHHIPESTVPGLLQEIHRHLANDGVLVIKDVADRPAWKRWFTYLLDKVMDPRCQVEYWNPKKLIHLLNEIGFTVRIHSMVDILPYPHVLYICTKSA